MNEILFYLISTSLFLVIIKEAMGIFFVKKDLPFSFSLIIWIVFLAVDICGTEYICTAIFASYIRNRYKPVFLYTALLWKHN